MVTASATTIVLTTTQNQLTAIIFWIFAALHLAAVFCMYMYFKASEELVKSLEDLADIRNKQIELLKRRSS